MPSAGFWFKVGRQWGTPEVSEAGGHINRSLFKDNQAAEWKEARRRGKEKHESH